VGETVETYLDNGQWRNRISGRDPLPGAYRRQEAAVEVGRAEARIRGVEHLIRNDDGMVVERRRYPRRPEEIPG
jgi:hypothetical protein